MNETEMRTRIAVDLQDIRNIPDLTERRSLHQILWDQPDFTAYRALRFQQRLEYIQMRKEATAEGTKKSILWAHKTYAEYKQLPKGTRIDNKKTDQFLSRTIQHLLDDPKDIDIVVGIWKSKDVDPEGNIPGDSFYQKAKKKAGEIARKRWTAFNPDQLSKLTKAFSHNQLTADFTGEILQQYFQGPRGSTQVADAHYKYAHVCIDLFRDQKSLETAVKIGLFQTDILPSNSVFAYNFFWAQTNSIDIDSQDKASKRKAVAALAQFIGFSSMVGIDGENIINDLSTHIADSPQYRGIMTTQLQRIMRRHGKLAVGSKITQRLGALTSITPDVLRRSGMMIDETDQRRNILFNRLSDLFIGVDEDPLMKKQEQAAGVTLTSKMFQRMAIHNLQEDGVIGPISVTVITPEGQALDLVLPQSLNEKRNAVIADTLRSLSGDPTSDRMGKLFYQSVSFCYFQRPTSEIEGNPHPLQTLETIGLPIPLLPEGQTLEQANEMLAQELQVPLRFMNQRGVVVPLEQDILKQLGYTRMKFFASDNESGVIYGQIFVGEIAYSVKLDRYLQFDLEGKSLVAPFVEDTLRYMMLSYLRAILCEETITTSTGERKNLYEIFERMAHLMLLPEEKHRTQRAIDLCTEHEGRDLIVMDLERRIEMTKRGIPVPTQREYTYVSQVHKEIDEGLDPIIVPISHLVQFRTT